MIARAERAHLAALAFLGALGDAFGLGVRHLPIFFDAFEVACVAPAELDRPLGAAGEHGIHLDGIERDRALAADAGRDLAKQRIGERLLHGQDVGHFEPGQHRAHAAGDIEADAARRHDAALVRIEGRHAADRETIAPVGVRHGIGRLHDSGQRRDIGRLLVDFVVHVADQLLIGVDDRRARAWRHAARRARSCHRHG